MKAARVLMFSSLILLLPSCGMDAPAFMDRASEPSKVRCPGDHAGFYVCMSTTSQINDPSLARAILEGLGDLAALVNDPDFLHQVESAYVEGNSVTSTLMSTNYIATILGYCNPDTTTLALARVGGELIRYNECRVSRDEDGNPDRTQVAGVLLHEIAHNIGYDHPPSDPERRTVPYYLGDLAEQELGGSASVESDYDRRWIP